MSPNEVHVVLVAVARQLSPSLDKALAANGPLWFPLREDRGLALQLARAIVGQQLSAKAARSIWARVEAARGDTPAAAFLCAKNTAALRGCGISGNKVKALVGIGQAEAKGRLDAAMVGAMDHDVGSAHLRAIGGSANGPPTWSRSFIAATRMCGRRATRRCSEPLPDSSAGGGRKRPPAGLRPTARSWHSICGGCSTVRLDRHSRTGACVRA